jgi:hypothetical protein
MVARSRSSVSQKTKTTLNARLAADSRKAAQRADEAKQRVKLAKAELKKARKLSKIAKKAAKEARKKAAAAVPPAKNATAARRIAAKAPAPAPKKRTRRAAPRGSVAHKASAAAVARSVITRLSANEPQGSPESPAAAESSSAS